MLERTLVRGSKRTTWTAEDTTLTTSVSGKPPTVEQLAHPLEAAQLLLRHSRTRVKQGWTSEDVEFPRRCVDAGLHPATFVAALTEAELQHFYAEATAERKPLTLEVLRKRPTRSLLEYLLGTVPPSPEFSKALKVITKKPPTATWVVEVLQQVLVQATNKPLRRFIERNLQAIERRTAPVPEPDAVVDGERRLLESIADAPDDDTPRLVYADYLSSRGEGWGEGIVVSCELESADWGTEVYAHLEARMRKLEKTHLRAWLAPIRPFITGWAVRRGLLGFVHTQPGKFVQAADAIALRAPRGELMLEGLKKKDLQALSKAPLGRFQEVRLSRQRLSDDQITSFVASPTLHGVEDWDLSGNPFGDPGVRAIARSSSFRTARRLDLSGLEVPTITARGLADLLTSPSLPALVELSVNVGELGEVLGQCTLPLQVLQLSTSGPLGPQLLSSVLDSPALQGLTHLGLQPSSRRRGPIEPVSDGLLVQVVGALPRLRALSVPWKLPNAVEEMLRAR